MANHPSAEKRNRQRITRTARNRMLRSALRTQLKAARLAIESGDKALATKEIQSARKALARAASKGVIHHNNASRKTSRLDHAIAQLA
jgi:small subunit ribosomal protein S20